MQGRIADARTLLTRGVDCNHVQLSHPLKRRPIHHVVTRRGQEDLLLQMLRLGEAMVGSEAIVPRGSIETTTTALVVDALDGSQQSALHIAAALGHKRMCALLLAHKADLELRDKHHHTPLMQAVLHRHERLACWMIIEAKASLDHASNVGSIRNKTIEPLIDVAARLNLIELTRILIDRGSRPTILGRSPESSLATIVATNGSIEMVRLLLIDAQVPVSEFCLSTIVAAAATTTTATTTTTNRDHRSIIELLLNHRADISSRDGKTGASVLHHVVQSNDVDRDDDALFKLLIDRGADVNATTIKGRRSVLHELCASSYPSIQAQQRALERARTLLDLRANVNQVDFFNSSALHHAARNQCVRMCLLLIDYGADKFIVEVRSVDSLEGLWHG